MSQPQPAATLPQNGATEAKGARISGSGRLKNRKFCALASGVLLGLASLTACSEGRRENSELRAEATADSAPAVTAPATAGPEANNAAEPAGVPATRTGARYRVAVETAYFFDQPEQSVPNGRYLRRGDTFYGEGETNGFVKTGFVQPNGSVGTGWLKVQSLSRMVAGVGTPRAGRAAPVSAGARPPAVPTARPAANDTETSALTGAQRAVVVVGRAYFHNSADLATPRKAHCERGDKVRLGEFRDQAVYVTFTNWEKVTTRGWMRQTDLRVIL